METAPQRLGGKSAKIGISLRRASFLTALKCARQGTQSNQWLTSP
jgi:hypothetical protein